MRWEDQQGTLETLAEQLAHRAYELRGVDDWPRYQLDLCGKGGVYHWFIPVEQGGWGWSDAEIVRGYLRLSAACLTTTFIITQRTGAAQRILGGSSPAAIDRWGQRLLSGEIFSTVAISHLSTSRRHLGKPAMLATLDDVSIRLDGYSAWVTGGDRAAVIVVGAELASGEQILVALPRETPGVVTPAPGELLSLSASRTGKLECHQVVVPRELLLAGPSANVMSRGKGGGTGGLQTSTLAIGLARAACNYLQDEAKRRPDLANVAEAFSSEQTALQTRLLELAEGTAACNNEDLRTQANSLVLRATQAALATAKGAGFVAGHPVGRWALEALFFLVWSCPQSVLGAHLCEWAHLQD